MNCASVLTCGERILVFLGRHSNRSFDPYRMPFEMTQDGISKSTGMSRAHVAVELKKLGNKGLVECGKAHPVDGKVMRLIYSLTMLGKAAVEGIKERLEDMGVEIGALFMEVPAEFRAGNHDPSLLKARENIKEAEAALEMSDLRAAIAHLSDAIRYVAFIEGAMR